MMVRQRAAAWAGAAALLVSCLLVAAPAQARWTDVGGSTNYVICKVTTPNGKAWRVRARATKPADVRHARVGLELWHKNKRVDRWRSGWIRSGEVARGRARIRKSRQVRIVVWEEAGDRRSSLGTSLVASVRKPKRVGRCPC